MKIFAPLFAPLFVTVVVTTLAFAGAARTADVDRTQQPAATPESAWAPPTAQRFTVRGIDVELMERHDVPIVELALAWNGGDILDPAGKEGMTSLCLDVIGEGTQALDKNALEDKKADIAAAIDLGAGREVARLGVHVAKDKLDPAMDLAAQLLLQPGLRAADFERLRAQRKASVLQQKGSAEAVAARVFGPVFYGAKHPYGRLVTPQSLDAISLKDCSAVAAQLLPEGATLFAVGDLTRPEVEALINAHFPASWKGRAPSRARIGPPDRPLDGKTRATIFFIDVPGAAQSRLLVAHPGPARGAADYDANQVMAQVLGGGMGSRLVTNLREKNGYTYGVRSGFAYDRSGSALTISTSVRTDATGKALREVMNELKGMTTRPADDDEVTRERSSAVRALPMRFSTGGSTLGALWELWNYDLPADTFQKLPERMKGVTTPVVAKSVKDHLRADGLTVIVAGDRAKVFEELTAIAKENIFGKDGLVVIDGDAQKLP